MNKTILIFSLIAGVIGTGFGGIIGVLLKGRSTRLMGRVLGFAGGVMTGVVVFEMIPESITSFSLKNAYADVFSCVGVLLLGMLAIYLINKLLDVIERRRERGRHDTYRASAVIQAVEHQKVGKSHKQDFIHSERAVESRNPQNRVGIFAFYHDNRFAKKPHVEALKSECALTISKGFSSTEIKPQRADIKQGNLPKTNLCSLSEAEVGQDGETAQERGLSSKVQKRKKSKKAKARKTFFESAPQSRELFKAGIIMFIAISLHNLPEGMAIGAAGAMETQTGILVALIIALHNIPEGMAISAPLSSGGVGAVKAVALTALAGFSTVIGALIGLAVGGLSSLATGICLALAGGAMLYVTFLEIIPQAISLNENNFPAVSFLSGIIVSVVFVFLV